MNIPLHIIWKQNGKVVSGWEVESQTWVNGTLAFPLGFPGVVGDATAVVMASSGRYSETFDILHGIRLYLDGEAGVLATVQQRWPAEADASHPELNGGLQISLDQGQTWITFDPEHGNKSAPETWLTLPASAVGSAGIDGVLGPFDSATLLLRWKYPPQATEFARYQLTLGVSIGDVS